MNFNNQIIVVPPVGSVTAFLGDISSYNNSSTAQSSPPNSTGLHPVEGYGWMVCDGRTLQKDEYPELYGMLGNIHGGDENTFNIPDLRGMFLRGVGSDKASIEDRENPQRTEKAQGVGSVQDFALQTHIHTYTAPTELTPSEGTEGTTVSGFDKDSETSTPGQSVAQMPGDVKVSHLETRPSNVFVYYIIKFTNHLPYFNPINS